MQAAWALALALLSVIAAVAILAEAFDAAFYDAEEPGAGTAVSPRALPEAQPETEAVVPLQRRRAPRSPRQPGRKAA